MRLTVAIHKAAREAQRRKTASGFIFAAKTRNTCSSQGKNNPTKLEEYSESFQKKGGNMVGETF